jgi:hypothetical protein
MVQMFCGWGFVVSDWLGVQTAGGPPQDMPCQRMLNGTAVSWKSKSQLVVALSIALRLSLSLHVLWFSR